ncbi:MAG: hypothetical protein MK116_02790 [Phycisphaerales bacterium]|nr:hypothetical protein [Phycisphaerales bacterium]
MIRSLALAVALSAVTVLVGCEETQRTTPRRLTPPRPKPEIMKVIRDARPNRMTLIVGPKAEDVEGDGQADIISVSVVLFAEPRPEPVIVPGEFVFEAIPMTRDEGGSFPPMIWRFTSAEVQASEGPTMFGLPGYRFKLDVRDVRNEPLPSLVVNIRGWFQPADGGPPVSCRPDQRLVRLGDAS